MSNKVFIGLILMIVVGVIGFIVLSPTTPMPKRAPILASLSSLNTGPAPWQPEYTHLADRLKADGLSLLGAEGNATHIHAHLDIYIHGQQLAVPAEIGIPSTGGITPVHTHDTSGIIHIESPDYNASYTLSQFFDIWGVKLTDTSIGGYTNNATDKLAVYDNGKAIKDPVNLSLSKHHEIVITYGTTQEQPHIAKSYSFPSGL